jgi:hypothetical protein
MVRFRGSMGVFGGQCGRDLGEIKAVAIPVPLE